jgi:hypothetical protein
VWLTDFFEEHPAPATFAAIVRGVLSGVDLDQLKLMAALKELWAQTPRMVERSSILPFAASFRVPASASRAGDP